jgi:hypothetical protein
LQNAVGLAPSKVQDEVCKLERIFILPEGATESWGLWLNPLDQTPHGSKPASYVALSSYVLSDGNFLEVEDNYVKSVARGTVASIRHSSADINEQNTKVYAVLSILLHEIGHIKWHRDNIYSSLVCYYDAFVPSWTADDMPSFKARRWAPVYTHDDAKKVRKGGSEVRLRNGNLRHPPTGLTLAQLRDIYNSGFVTGVAAVSPEEDFVETYRIGAYRENNLSLMIRIPPDDISVTGNTSANAKFTCIDTLF